ncbi:hypothetical protein C0993_012304 [Termitomyces sp. T159_Od127]|nr:hypothetical protein C0993_012304 [Termitomyces sp. T159_Od127]
MKFKLSFIAAAVGILFSAAEAQRATIGYPPDGTSVTPGSNLTVEVDRENSLTGSVEVAVIIGVTSCLATGCLPVSDGLGTVLYNGEYNPEFHPDAPFYKPPHQNFTITIPPTLSNGTSQLGVVRVSLLGASSVPITEFLNLTLNVA